VKDSNNKVIALAIARSDAGTLPFLPKAAEKQVATPAHGKMKITRPDQVIHFDDGWFKDF